MLKKGIIALALLTMSAQSFAAAVGLILLAPTVTIGGVSYLSSKQAGTSNESVKPTDKAFNIHRDVVFAAQPEAQAFNADEFASLKDMDQKYPILKAAVNATNTSAAEQGLILDQKSVIDFIADYKD